MLSQETAEKYRSLLQAVHNEEGRLGEIGVYLVKRIFVEMSEIEGGNEAFKSARSAYNTLFQIHEETEMDVEVINVLSHFSAEQIKILALAGFRSGLDDEDICLVHFDLSLDWDIPDYYFDRYGGSTEEEVEEVSKRWWEDQDRIVEHYLNLGKKVRLGLTSR